MNFLDHIHDAIRTELTMHPHCKEERAELFQSFDSCSAELEVCEFLWSLVRMLKPNKVIETGTATGIASLAIADAMQTNGFGKLYTIEKDEAAIRKAKKRLSGAGLERHVEFVHGDSISFCRETKYKFRLAFFDSAIPIRCDEFEALAKRGMVEVAVFHDTSRKREKTLVTDESQSEYIARLKQCSALYCSGDIEFELSRGLRIMQASQFIEG